MSIPKIDPYPPAPTPEDDEATFDDKAYAHAASLELRRVQMNEVASYVNTRAADANNRAVAAAASATASANSATRSDEWANKAPGSVVASGKYSARHYSDLSDRFANAPEDVEVAPGKYSAQHYMEKAKKIAEVHATTVETDPLPTVIATNVQEALRDLAYQADQLRVAKNQLRYGDGPYPVMDFQFAGAKYLDSRIQFTRASLDWDEEGNEYGVDEPVLTDKGLWGSGVRANLLTESKDFLGWSVTPAASLARGYGQSPFNWGRSALFKQAENTTGSPYFHRTATAQQYTEGVMYTASLYVKPLASNSSNNPIRVILHQQMFESQCNVGLTPDGQISKGSGATFAGCDPAGNGFYRIWVTGKAATTGTSWAPIAWPLRSMLEEGEGWEVFGMQLEEGISPTPYMPTEASQVTVADGVLNSIRTDRLRSVVIDLELLRNLIDNNTLYILSWGKDRTGHIPTNGIMVWVAGFTNSIQVRIYTNGSYMSRTIPGNWEDLRKLGVSIFPDKIVVAADGVVREIETDRDVVDEAIFANLHPATHVQSKYRWLKSAAFYERALTTEQLQELTT